MKKTALIFLVFGFWFLVFGPYVSAQSPTRIITIVPPGKEVSLNPGETSEGILKVVNDSEEALTFNVSVRDYIVSDNKGTPEVLPPNTLSNKYSAASWIAVYPSTFTVLPHQRQELNYYVQVPADARPGGHYAATMYEPSEIIGVQGTGTGVATHLGTLFYVHVKGDINENAIVKQFSPSAFSEYGPVTITSEIQNNGDLHIKPKGTIVIKNMIGQTVETKVLEEHNIFPEKSYLHEQDFGKKWMIGRYTATLTATYGLNNNLPLVATASFIVFPWKIATIIVLLIVIIILTIIILSKKKNNRTVAPTAPAPNSPADHPQL